MKAFGIKIKELRLEKKLLQKDLGVALGVDQRTVSNWEQGINKPDIDMLIKIAEFFEVSIDFLLGLKNTNDN